VHLAEQIGRPNRVERPLSLYQKWEEGSRSAKVKGSFILDPALGLLPARNNRCDSEETILLSRAVCGKWATETSRVISASRLYAWTVGEKQASYVVSALSVCPRAYQAFAASV
jgi:hypothetical protein